jgi:hypothetical protein
MVPRGSLYRSEPELVDGAIRLIARCRLCNQGAPIPRPGSAPAVQHATNCPLLGIPPRKRCH